MAESKEGGVDEKMAADGPLMRVAKLALAAVLLVVLARVGFTRGRGDDGEAIARREAVRVSWQQQGNQFPLGSGPIKADQPVRFRVAGMSDPYVRVEVCKFDEARPHRGCSTIAWSATPTPADGWLTLNWPPVAGRYHLKLFSCPDQKHIPTQRAWANLHPSCMELHRPFEVRP